MDENSEAYELDDQQEQMRTEPSEELPWGAIIGTIGMILVVVFAVQNTGSAEVRFLWLRGSFPLAIVIVASAVGGAVFSAVGNRFLRRRRRKRWEEKEALRRLRDED